MDYTDSQIHMKLEHINSMSSQEVTVDCVNFPFGDNGDYDIYEVYVGKKMVMSYDDVERERIIPFLDGMIAALESHV